MNWKQLLKDIPAILLECSVGFIIGVIMYFKPIPKNKTH